MIPFLPRRSFCAPNAFPKRLRVGLLDGLEPDTRIYDVRKPVDLCAPAGKDGHSVGDPETHLQGYPIALTKGRCALVAPVNAGGGCTGESDCGGNARSAFCVTQPKSVKQLDLQVTNPFHPANPLTVDIGTPDRLLVPAAKNLESPPSPIEPSNVDLYKCYTVTVSKAQPKLPPILGVLVDDSFIDGRRAFDIKKPTRLCLAAANADGIPTVAAHLMCYQAAPSKGLCSAGAPISPNSACTKEEDCGGTKRQTSFCALQPAFRKVTGIFVDNQLTSSKVDLTREDELCVPSQLLGEDTTPPVIAGVPDDMTVVSTVPTGVVVTYTAPTATDLVSGMVPVACVPASGATFPREKQP